jgi:hypothetical protein
MTERKKLNRKTLNAAQTTEHIARQIKALTEMPNDLLPVYGGGQQGIPVVPDKHAGGRPTEYTPELCEKVIELGKKGYTKEHMALELGWDHQTLENWCVKYPEFLVAMTQAVKLAQGFMEKLALEALSSDKDFKTTLWSKIMSCRFPETYREVQRKEHSGPNGSPIPVAVVAVVVDTPEQLRDHYKSVMDGNNVNSV